MPDPDLAGTDTPSPAIAMRFRQADSVLEGGPAGSPHNPSCTQPFTSPPISQALCWDTEMKRRRSCPEWLSIWRGNQMACPRLSLLSGRPPLPCAFHMRILGNRQTTKQSDQCQEGAIESSVGENPQWSPETSTKDISRSFRMDIASSYSMRSCES